MIAGVTDQGVCLFDFYYRHSIKNILARVETAAGVPFEDGDHPLFAQLEQEIAEYFQGVRQKFDVPLHLAGTDFQVRVWQALLEIPYGETRSYEQQSLAIGNTKAIRAVAGANGENGIAIIVPCHRVIGKNGSLTGYGGGLPMKQKLLDLEFRFSGKSLQGNLF